MRFDKRQITNIKIEGIDRTQYPQFEDAYIVSACYKGEPMDETDIEKLNQDSEFVWEKVMEKLF